MNMAFTPGMMYGGRPGIIGAHMADGYGFGGFLWLFGLVLLGALVAGLVVWLIGRKRHDAPAPAPTAAPAGDTALEIARGRLARGEIDPEQYAAIVAALNT